MRFSLLAAAFAALVTTAAVAHEFKAGSLEIIHPHIPAPAPIAKTAAGYMAIANDGTEPDRLIGVDVTGASSAMLHESAVDANGMAVMTHLDRIDIPPGETVVFEPGALHVMITGLTAPFEAGAEVPAVLIFERAGRVDVTFMIEPPDGEATHEGH